MTCVICGDEIIIKSPRQSKKICSGACYKELNCRKTGAYKRSHGFTRQERSPKIPSLSARIETKYKDKERPLTLYTEYFVCIWHREGTSIGEIAAILDRSPDNVKEIIKVAKETDRYSGHRSNLWGIRRSKERGII